MFSQGKFQNKIALILVFISMSLSNCASEDSSGSSSSEDNTTTSTDNSSSTTSDTKAPTISSISPEDNTTNLAVSTTVAVTFSESMSTDTITTNTDNTTCFGSFRLSSDNFTTCIKMYAAPSASNSDKTFTVTPDDNLSRGTNYKILITSSSQDTSSNSLADNYTTSNGFTTYGTGTIRGTVRYDNNSAADNVSVSYTLSGTFVDNTTTDSSGDFSQDNLSLGTYTLTFTKSNFNDASLSATIAADNQSVTANVTMLADTCSEGTVAGTITDAVTGDAISDISLSVRSGLNVTSGDTTGTATTASNGTYTFSSISAGGYTVEASKSGYITAYFNINVCGNLTGQNANISEELSSGAMRIVVSWPTGSTATDLDSHLQVPDNASGNKHIYYSLKKLYYATNSSTCSGCSNEQESDNVTLDLDDTTAPGTETISITNVRDGTYSYSVHDYTNRNNTTSTNLALSGTSVSVYYNNTTTSFSVPNSSGNLWRVFSFTSSGGIREVGTMSNESTPASIY